MTASPLALSLPTITSRARPVECSLNLPSGDRYPPMPPDGLNCCEMMSLSSAVPLTNPPCAYPGSLPWLFR
ncbi:Uncharacterised protein [Mycobacteroides abscessus subsp. abscessus]|nr:Uncharacterised protein [Mycobacteroides abscessus subsp. abscessus]